MTSSNSKLTIQAVQEAVSAGGGSWEVRETEHWALSPQQQRLRLGAVPPTMSIEARELLATQRPPQPAAGVTARPGTFDWRSVNGVDFVTSIKDQGACGSCVAFGSAATVETTARVMFGASLNIDLSEAQLFYCVARSQGSTCASGWWPDQAFRAFESPGITDERHYPYTAGDQSCGLIDGWQNVVSKVTAWHTISSPEDMKVWLSTRGALAACFTVYQDFYAYGSGVYRHSTGSVVGGHCVSIVGFDDGAQCWICKNSWGSGWGESGFFRIGYGQCGIDAEAWAADGVIVPAADTIPLYRYWNSVISDHFYTTNWAELGHGKNNWEFEQTQCYVFASLAPGRVPLYRYWNGTAGDHFYTTNWAELGSGREGYSYEGIQCYVYPTGGPGSAALYRYWSPGGSDHFYTTNWSELGTGNFGWHLEGTQCYVPAGPAVREALMHIETPATFRPGQLVGAVSSSATADDAL